MKQYYVVIDLEFVKVPRNMRKIYKRGTETVQIGAVLLDEDFNIIDRFESFISPKYGWLDSEIMTLTGIKKKMLYNAPDFYTAMKRFNDWIEEHIKNGDTVKFVEWSDSDQRQLEYEMVFHGFDDTRENVLFSGWIDCQTLFGAFMNEPNRRYALQDALSITVIDQYDERMHDALADAYNTAILFGALMKKELRLSPYLTKKEAETTKLLSCTLGDLFGNALFQHV